MKASNKKEKLIKWYRSIGDLSDLEDWFTGAPMIEGTKIEDVYWALSRLKDNIFDIFWYYPLGFIHNIIKYRRILWYDRWWDYYHLLFMLQIKLEQDAKYYKRHGMCTTSKETAEEMERVIALLKRINNDNYDNLEDQPKDIKKVFKYIGNKLPGWWD